MSTTLSPAASTIGSRLLTTIDSMREKSECSSTSLCDSRPATGCMTTRYRIFADFMLAEIDGQTAKIPLAFFCFMSGFMGCISFSACSIWVGYQTGNTVQTALALSRLTYNPHGVLHGFAVSDWQALCSVVCFALSAQFGGRLSFWNRKSRAWIAFSTSLQLFLTIGASILIHYCDEPTFSYSRQTPSWHNIHGYAAIAMLSASFGLQGVIGETMGTGYTATVVLTSVYCQLATLPSPLKWSKPRDERLLSILLFLLGGFFSRLILAEIGSSGAIAIGAGIRFVLVPMWIFLPSSVERLVLPTVQTSRMAKSGNNSRLQLQPNDSRLTMVG